MPKKTNTARSARLQHLGHMGISDLGMDHVSRRAQGWNIKGCHGEAKAVGKETNTALSAGLEHLGHTGRSHPGFDQ